MSGEAASVIPPQVLKAAQAGRRLDADELRTIAVLTDILALGALADEVRRRHRGAETTFVRVHVLDVTRVDAWSPPPAAAGEVRLEGWPSTLGEAVEAVRRAKTIAGGRPLRGFSLARVWVAGGATGLRELADAGLDEVAWVETGPEASTAVMAARTVGLTARVVGVDETPADRVAWLASVQALQDAVGGLDVVAPLPRAGDPTVPTTGYDDVRTVALARLALDGATSIQVDWRKDGPKLAQVALTVGADDLDLVSPLDELSRGPRRAPLEEVKRNIAAAGLVAVERDGRRRRLVE